MKIMVLGGDGFCGWPSSLRLAHAGHDVIIVDNLCRRRIDVELGAKSLTPIATMATRVKTWNALWGSSSRPLRFAKLDIANNYAGLLKLLRQEAPNCVVHFAEQRSAPYSMRSPLHKRYTVGNNVSTTHNLLCAIVESGLDIHVVHLGTMGVYGYGGGAHIPEGYQKAKFEQPNGTWLDREILFPADPGSVYHMTKTLDQMLFYFYNKNDAVRVTDLHQGIVWGTNTDETLRDPRLVNRFDYDGEFGTVLNRFLVQAAIGHPLTIYGSGGQTRAFIHIKDTVECIRLAAENAPKRGERVRIFNQMTEAHCVRELAALVVRLSGVKVEHYSNPRQEAEQNELHVERKGLQSLGLKPTTLADGLLEEVIHVAEKYKSRIDRSKISSKSFWNAARARAAKGSEGVLLGARPKR